MALLDEFAITPDVFDCVCFPHEDVCGAHLQTLKEVLLESAIVRDLRNGDWGKYLNTKERSWHRRGPELLKKLQRQNRLVQGAPALTDDPRDDADWCKEALRSHVTRPMTGIISTRDVARAVGSPSEVADVSKLSSSPWWAARSNSIRPRRNIADYREAMTPLALYANSLMFIDAYLDPVRPDYSEFLSLLELCSGRDIPPVLEVHRTCYLGSGRQREVLSASQWESRFRNAWEKELQSRGLTVEVFIWDDMHDRYLITDLAAIKVGYGFSTTRNPTETTTWTRIGRDTADDIQREFDPDANDPRHALRHRFVI